MDLNNIICADLALKYAKIIVSGIPLRATF